MIALTEEEKKLIPEFLEACKCRDCGAIRPEISQEDDEALKLCSRCFRKKFGVRI